MSAVTMIEHEEVGSGGAASITFSSIPSTYTDLLIVLSGRSTRTGFPVANVQVSFNGTSTNESYRNFRARTPNTIEIESFTTIVFGHIASADNSANTFSNSSLQIFNYASSLAKNMTFDTTTESGNTDTYASFNEFYSAIWNDTSAISSISFTPDTGNFAQYSSATLYGITAGSDGTTVVS